MLRHVFLNFISHLNKLSAGRHHDRRRVPSLHRPVGRFLLILTFESSAFNHHDRPVSVGPIHNMYGIVHFAFEMEKKL